MAELMQESDKENYIPLHITAAAEQYLEKLLKKQNIEGIGVRVFITQPGTPYAETCLAYCRSGEEEITDQKRQLPAFILYIDEISEPFLHQAIIDYSADRMGGQLTIKAPNSRLPQIDGNSPLADQVNYFLYSEINPGLAMHGGEVRLLEITYDNYAVLQFGGGCQGCAAIDITLKDGIEKILLNHIPQLRGVRDFTDHTDNSNAYY